MGPPVDSLNPPPVKNCRNFSLAASFASGTGDGKRPGDGGRVLIDAIDNRYQPVEVAVLPGRQQSSHPLGCNQSSAMVVQQAHPLEGRVGPHTGVRQQPARAGTGPAAKALGRPQLNKSTRAKTTTNGRRTSNRSSGSLTFSPPIASQEKLAMPGKPTHPALLGIVPQAAKGTNDSWRSSWGRSWGLVGVPGPAIKGGQPGVWSFVKGEKGLYLRP